MFNLIKYWLLLKQILCLFTNFQVLATPDFCIGKHQMDVQMFKYLEYKELEPIEFIDFDKMPSETVLTNDGHLLRIDLKFIDTVPMIKINFESSLGVKGTFRLEYLYFQWLQQLPIDTEQTDGIGELLENLKFVSESDSKIAIENRNLTYWLKQDMQRFYVYEGSLLEFDCERSVIWIDFIDVLRIKPEMVEEFGELKTKDSKPLMNEIPEFFMPREKVYRNFDSLLTIGSAPVSPFLGHEIEYNSDGKSGVERAAHYKIERIQFILMILLYIF